MRNRHMLALLLGTAPIVLAAQVTAQQPANHAATTNHQGMDHATMNHAANANTTELTTPPDDTAPAMSNTAEIGNSGDDQPPK